MPPASVGGSPRSASGSLPSFFQITASALVLGSCEILCTPFKSGVSVSYRPLAVLYASPTSLQSQMFWRFIFLVQEPWAGEPVCGACTPHTLGRTSAVVTIFSFVGHLWVLTILSLRPSYLSYCGSFFISLVWKTFSASLQVVLIDSCSINSCNLGVPMGGGKLRVFLLCHLGHSFVSVS